MPRVPPSCDLARELAGNVGPTTHGGGEAHERANAATNSAPVLIPQAGLAGGGDEELVMLEDHMEATMDERTAEREFWHTMSSSSNFSVQYANDIEGSAMTEHTHGAWELATLPTSRNCLLELVPDLIPGKREMGRVQRCQPADGTRRDADASVLFRGLRE